MFLKYKDSCFQICVCGVQKKLLITVSLHITASFYLRIFLH